MAEDTDSIEVTLLMLRLLIRPGLLLLAMLTALVSGVRGVYSLTHQPESEFTHEGCSGPCWRGLDMRSATYDDVAAALGVADFPVHQRYHHHVENLDTYVMFYERLVFLEVQGIDCPVELLLQWGRPYTSVIHHTGQRTEVLMYFYSESSNSIYNVLWDSDTAFSFFH
ncbi:MAG: hypothetical protein AAFR56_22340, partial [Chloroflexota bacterium]